MKRLFQIGLARPQVGQAILPADALHLYRLRAVWGRLLTCGRLAIGPENCVSRARLRQPPPDKRSWRWTRFSTTPVETASTVVEAIHYREHGLGLYHLHSYVAMGNHVRLLITPRVEVSKLIQWLQRLTAREGNRIRCLTARPCWQGESYGRVVRDETECRCSARYIEMSPVNAGMAATPEAFPGLRPRSSAWPIDNRPQVDNLPHK